MHSCSVGKVHHILLCVCCDKIEGRIECVVFRKRGFSNSVEFVDDADMNLI